MEEEVYFGLRGGVHNGRGGMASGSQSTEPKEDIFDYKHEAENKQEVAQTVGSSVQIH